MFKTLTVITGLKKAKSIKLPKFAVKLAQKGAASAVLNSTPATPDKLKDSGFSFRYTTVAEYAKAVWDTLELT